MSPFFIFNELEFRGDARDWLRKNFLDVWGGGGGNPKGGANLLFDKYLPENYMK